MAEEIEQSRERTVKLINGLERYEVKPESNYEIYFNNTLIGKVQNDGTALLDYRPPITLDIAQSLLTLQKKLKQDNVPVAPQYPDQGHETKLVIERIMSELPGVHQLEELLDEIDGYSDF